MRVRTHARSHITCAMCTIFWWAVAMHEAKRDISKKVKRYPSLIFKPPVSGIGDGGQRVENAAQKYLASRAHVLVGFLLPAERTT